MSSTEDKPPSLRALAEGENTLVELFRIQRADLVNWGNGRFLSFYCATLGLQIDEIALANVAWCATNDNRYPGWMLTECFERHTLPLLRLLDPHYILLSGAAIRRFGRRLRAALPTVRVIAAPHYAHREGTAYEIEHALRIRRELDEACSTPGT